jgi:hypothetical protein
LNEPNGYSIPGSHKYEPTTAVDSRPTYPPYDMHMHVHGPSSLPQEPCSTGVSSIASTSYTNEGDAASATQKYIVHPSQSAPLMQGDPHQGFSTTLMAMPGHQYHYPVTYNADPWNPTDLDEARRGPDSSPTLPKLNYNLSMVMVVRVIQNDLLHSEFSRSPTSRSSSKT